MTCDLCVRKHAFLKLVIIIFQQLTREAACSSWYVSTVAGSDNGFQDGVGTNVRFRGPSGVCLGVHHAVDSLFVSDGSNHRIRVLNLETGAVSTVAGSGAFFGGYADGPGSLAQFNAPGGIAWSTAESKVFIADSLNHRIRCLHANGTVSTAAGTSESVLGTFVGGYLDGPAEFARFNAPKSVAMARDSSSLYIADTNNHRIRVFNVDTNAVWTLAGAGFAGAEDGNATSAQFSSPSGIAISADGTKLFVADSWNHRIRTVSTLTGIVETLSGAAQFGGGFRDGAPTLALFRQPSALVAMPSGDSVVVGDTGNGRVRLININEGGTTGTLAGAGVNLFQDGLGTGAWFASPSGMAASETGSTIFVSDFWNDRVRVMALCASNKPPFSRYTGRVVPYLGTDCGWECELGYFQTATLSCQPCASPIQNAEHVGSGAVVGNAASCPWQCKSGYFLSSGVCQPCTSSPCAVGEYRQVCTPVKNGLCAACTNGPPYSIYTDHGGDQDECPFQCNSGYAQVGSECKDDTFWVAKALAGGILGTGALDGVGTWAMFNRPNGLASARGPSGEWFVDVADTGNHRIRRVNVLTEETITLAGLGVAGYANGDATAAKFSSPVSVATSHDASKVFVADKDNHLIRVVDVSAGSVTSLAGRATVPGMRNGVATNALFNAPVYIATHPDGEHLLVADADNHRIRKVSTATGEVVTVAGSGDRGGWRDGPAASARFFSPGGLAVSQDMSSLYVADRLNSRLRAVNLTSGAVSTLSGGEPGYRDGRVSLAEMDGPLGVAPYNGTLLFADRWNHRVRAVDEVSGYITTLLVFRFGQRGTATEAGDLASTVDDKALVASDGNSAVWMLLKCVDQFAASGDDCPFGQYKGVCRIDDPQVQCTGCTNPIPPEAFYTGPGFPSRTNNCPWQCSEGYFVSRTTLLSGPQLITEHLVLPFYISTSPNYELSFHVKLFTVTANWRYLVGLSATYLDCCSYGDRIPQIAIHPLDTSLRVAVGGQDGDGNLLCPFRTPSLPIGTWSHVRVTVTDQYAVTYINNTAVSDKCLVGPREHHDNVRVDIGGEVSSVEVVDGVDAMLDNVTYSRLHCSSCPTSECAAGYFRGPCVGFQDGSCQKCTPPPTLSGPVYFTGSGLPESNDCSFAACNMSSCGIGEYRTECGHDYPATCAPCVNEIPAYSDYSGPADPPTNATTCPYTCWSGFYREPAGGTCIPDGAVGGQFGNVSLEGLGLDLFFGFRPSLTFEATMRYRSNRIDDIIQTYRAGVAIVAQRQMRFVLVVAVEDALNPNGNVSFLNQSAGVGASRRAQFNYIHVTTRVWTEQGLLGELEALLTEERLNEELVQRGLPIVFLNGVPTDEEYLLALEKYLGTGGATPAPRIAETSDTASSSLPPGAIAAIVLGVLTFLMIGLAAVFFFFRRMLSQPKEAKVQPIQDDGTVPLNRSKGDGFKEREVYNKRSASAKEIAVVPSQPVVGHETPVAWREELQREAMHGGSFRSSRAVKQEHGSFKERSREVMRKAYTMRELRQNTVRELGQQAPAEQRDRAHRSGRSKTRSPHRRQPGSEAQGLENQKELQTLQVPEGASHGGQPAEAAASVRQPAHLRRSHTTGQMGVGAATESAPPGLVNVGWGSFRVQLV